MTIEEKENQLFKEWENKRKPFVRDGVVSEEHYLQSKQKIVFILKEANDDTDENGDWGLEKDYDSDLRKYLAKGAPNRGYTWNNVTRWVDGIRQFDEKGNWTYHKDIPEDFRKETLKSICSMNLKKTPGGGSASQGWEKVAEEDGDFIQKQYALYDPDITICGGTGEEFQRVMGHEHKGWQNENNDWAWWYERETGKYVIYTWHPQARERSEQLQKELIDVIRKIYK